MHEEVLAKPGGLVQFEKMTGRPGKEVEEENVVMEELLGPKERIDVEIKDYNPSMAKAKTFQMADPVKQPRFEKPAKPQYDPNVSIAPNYDYIKEKQAPVADFNKMQGRRDFDKDADLEVIEAAFGGEKDDRTGVQAARERAEAIQKAKDFTSTRTPFMVDMSKGKERSYITPGQQVGEVVELPDGAESDQRPVIEPIKVKGGVTDWSKTTGRNDKELEEKLMKEQFGEEEQLDIDPEKVTTSRYYN